MIYIMALLIVGAFITYITHRTYARSGKPEDREYAPNAVKNCLLVVTPIIIAAIVFPMWESFSGYCKLKEKQATIDQYKTAVELYTKHANVPTGAEGKLISDLTDSKYEGYQRQLAEYVTKYREAVIDYNKGLVARTTWNNTWSFGWIVKGPDADMKPIKMEF